MTSRISLWASQASLIIRMRFFPDAFHFSEALGLLVDDVEGFLAEPGDQALGHDRSDPLDEAGPQVFFDPQDARRNHGLVGLDLELVAVRGVGRPIAPEV